LFLYAGALQSLNKDAEAIRIYEQLITLFPEQMEASVLLAGVYEQQDLKAEARKVLEEFIKRNQNNPNTAIVLYYLAKLYENNNYNLALEAYKKAYLIDAKTERSLRAYVLLALKNGRFKEVGELCKIALGQQENKKFPQLIIDSLKMTNKEEFVSKIITELEDSDLNLKSEAEIRFKLALLFIEQHQLKEALRELHFVLADNPKHNQARFYIATIYAGAGKIQQALQYLQQIDPGQEIFLKSRTLGAYIAKQNGQADLAEKFIREAHQSNPADEKIFSYYLLILKDSKKYHEAAEMLKTRIDAGNPSIQNLFQYGIVLHDLGKQSQALDVMEQVLQKDSEHADALNFIAYGLAEKKKELPKALEYIQRALKKNPNDPVYLDTLGWVYFRMGQNKTAEEHLAKAVSLSDNDSVLLDHYADVLFELGQLDRALIHYRQALEVEFDKTNGDPRLIKHVEGKINKIRSKLNKKSN
jgi:tetratricopeptide (TPR) repeat protein